MNDELAAIFDRIAHGQFTDADVASLRQFLESGDRKVKAHFAKFNVNIGEGKDIHIGDRIYQGIEADKLRDIFIEVLQNQDQNSAFPKTQQQYRIENNNRQNLLDIVYRDWVKGCLEQSLHNDIQIKLGLENRQDVVESPWATLASPRQVLPQGTRIIDQFKSLARRRLLILGQPGAGKTMALLELAKDLIEQAKEDSTLPIPVVFHLSTWKIPNQSLKEWLIAELSSKYDFKEVITVPWIESNQLLLLLDGLDEVRTDWQEDCVKNINKFSHDYGQIQMVVCSRLDDYEKLSGKLRCDTALLIQPLNSEQIDQYLQNLQEVSGTNLQAIRSAVVKRDLAELAKTPLFLWIMSLIYKGDAAAELPREQSTEEEIKQHLFSQYIDRMTEPPDRGQRYPYPQVNKKRSKQDKPSHIYTKEETLAWLQFLAKRLNRESNSIFLIEQLDPNWLPPNVSPWLYRLGVGLTAGLIIEWVYGLSLGLIGGVLSYQMLSGLFAGLSLGVIGSVNSEIKLFDSLGWSWSWSRALKAVKSALLSIPMMIIILLLTSLTSITSAHPSEAIIIGLFTGLVAAIISGCVTGLVETKPKAKDTKVVATNQGIWRSMQKSVVTTLVTLIILILPITFYIPIFFPASVLLGCISLYVGGMTCLQHLTLRTLLWQTNNAPWNYAYFLNYATNRLLINRAGGGYLFIHVLLRQNLAAGKEHIKSKQSWQSYRQGIVFGVLIGTICLTSILLPTVINSWKVTLKTAEIFSPRIQVGDRLLTDRLSPRMGWLKLGDIINFKPIPEMSYSSGTIIKGEVLGCPSDTLNIKEGKVIINGKILPDKYLKMHLDLSEYLPNPVPSNSYLIIARKYKDNKSSLVIIPYSSIEEKVILRIWPTFEFI